MLGATDNGQDASYRSPGVRTTSPLDRLVIRPIAAADHTNFARTHSASFLQTPEWAGVKPGWRPESLGWFRADDVNSEQLLGTALVLHRQVPAIGRSLAYVPEGPVLPWANVLASPPQWLDPFVAHLRAQRAFAVRIGPHQVVRLWHSATAKRGLVDPQVRRFGDLIPDELVPDGAQLVNVLRKLGWRSLDEAAPSGSFGGGQPRFGLRIDLRGKTSAELLAETNQQWRRNVSRSAKAGVVVREGGRGDIETFHRLYRETAERDSFIPRPAPYFDGMWQALASTSEPLLRIYLAELGPDREPLAAALTIQVGGHCWYSYGASTSRHREAQGSTALQWAAICAAQARGCHTYDMRGIADTLDQEEPLTGLVRFKLSTGGSCVETVGEWEWTLSPFWNRAHKLYLRSRS